MKDISIKLRDNTYVFVKDKYHGCDKCSFNDDSECMMEFSGELDFDTCMYCLDTDGYWVEE